MSRHHQQRLQAIFAKTNFPPPKEPDNEFKDDETLPPDDLDDDDVLSDDEFELSGHLRDALAAVMATDPTLTKHDAARWLIYTPHGRAFVRHLLSKRQQEITPMDRMTQLTDFVKQQDGLIKLAKYINSAGASSISESEFTKLIETEARAKGVSFAKYFEAPENVEIRRAHLLTRGF